MAAVRGARQHFVSDDKGLTELIPAEVEAVERETAKKMELFGNCGRAL